MKQDTNPSREHRPNRWARLKQQLKRVRAEAQIADRQKMWAHLFIALNDQWQDFSRWAQEQADKEADPTESVVAYFANALNTARAEAEQAAQRLTIAQKMSKMYEDQKNGYYSTLATLSAQIDKLMGVVADLTDTTVKQREEIVRLKKQRQHNESPDEGNATDRPE